MSVCAADFHIILCVARRQWYSADANTVVSENKVAIHFFFFFCTPFSLLFFSFKVALLEFCSEYCSQRVCLQALCPYSIITCLCTQTLCFTRDVSIHPSTDQIPVRSAACITVLWLQSNGYTTITVTGEKSEEVHDKLLVLPVWHWLQKIPKWSLAFRKVQYDSKHVYNNQKRQKL